jgi:hypothetical protein
MYFVWYPYLQLGTPTRTKFVVAKCVGRLRVLMPFADLCWASLACKTCTWRIHLLISS